MRKRSKFNVIWSKTAYQDLDSLISFIGDQSPINADRLLTKIQKKAATLNVMPQRGRLVPELKEWGVFFYRELIMDPWRIIYRVSLPSTVYVMGVIDSRRNVEDILLERFLED